MITVTFLKGLFNFQTSGMPRSSAEAGRENRSAHCEDTRSIQLVLVGDGPHEYEMDSTVPINVVGVGNLVTIKAKSE